MLSLSGFKDMLNYALLTITILSMFGGFCQCVCVCGGGGCGLGVGS